MDLYKIIDFIFDKNEKRVGDVELEETFMPSEGDNSSPLELVQRIKREVKSGQHEQHEAIRMTFVKALIEGVSEIEGDVEDNVDFSVCPSDCTSGSCCMNTFRDRLRGFGQGF